MRLAIIYWRMIHSVGGIATSLNTMRKAALQAGDTCHILLSDCQVTKRPQVFPERKWVSGGDTKIWICGEAPHHPDNVEQTVRWLEANYDAIFFGFICPHKTTAYPEPKFLPIYNCRLPKVTWITDGYWDTYAHWANPLLPKLRGIICQLESYALPLRQLGVCESPGGRLPRLKISGIPFLPQVGRLTTRSMTPLLVWPNQWKDVKGIKPFLEQVPLLPYDLSVELYSCGIRYYQLRSDPCWDKAVCTDKFKGHNGHGRATYFGNVDLPVVLSALQRAWFTVNLQGMKSRKETYKRGSYNNTELEALYYGACPILHRSTLQTNLPQDTYLAVRSAEEIPDAVYDAIGLGYALDPARQRRARDFVLDKHLASSRYQDLKDLL
jgi:hypothetical protein